MRRSVGRGEEDQLDAIRSAKVRYSIYFSTDFYGMMGRYFRVIPPPKRTIHHDLNPVIVVLISRVSVLATTFILLDLPPLSSVFW